MGASEGGPKGVDLRDLAALAGLVLLTAGLAWIYTPMVLITPGVLLLALAVVGHLRDGDHDSEPKRERDER